MYVLLLLRNRAIIDPLGYKPPRRHEIPEGIVEQANGQAIYYKETIAYDDEGEPLPGPSATEVHQKSLK